jgi:hypothetical protein
MNQATMFLHDNGVLLHYDDVIIFSRSSMVMRYVVTVREINPFARTGVMKMDDLQHLFKSSCLGINDNRSYIVSLLNKFYQNVVHRAENLQLQQMIIIVRFSRCPKLKNQFQDYF